MATAKGPELSAPAERARPKDLWVFSKHRFRGEAMRGIGSAVPVKIGEIVGKEMVARLKVNRSATKRALAEAFA